MKKLFIAIMALLLSVSSFSQKEGSVVITPGVGIGKLKLGMSEKQVFDILKGDISWESYDQALRKFMGWSPEVDSVFQFVIGFDSTGTYGGDLPKSMPVYGIYFKNHQLNFITVSSYGTSDEQVKSVKLVNGLKFHDSMETCAKKMGKDFISLEYYAENKGDHYYYKEGLEFVYDENGKLVSIGIFKPMPNAKKQIAERSPVLRKQTKAIVNEEEEED